MRFRRISFLAAYLSQDEPGELTVNDISNHRKKVTRLEPSQAYETLGVFLAPDGNLNSQFKKMLKAVTTWVDGLRTGKLSREEVWLALQSTILRTLYYPLPPSQAITIPMRSYLGTTAQILFACLRNL